MLLIVVIAVIVFLGATALAAVVHQQSRSLRQPHSAGELPREPVTLFGPAPGPTEAAADRAATSARLLARAEEGDLKTLHAARSQANLYARVLDGLIDFHGRQGDISALVKYITKSDDLRGNARLAERVIAAWQNAPDRRSTVEMLHVAAISDNADTYHRAVDLAIEAFNTGRLGGLAVADLLALLESQYWVLATEARSGGPGFALKQRLNEARRELAAATSLK